MNNEPQSQQETPRCTAVGGLRYLTLECGLSESFRSAVIEDQGQITVRLSQALGAGFPELKALDYGYRSFGAQVPAPIFRFDCQPTGLVVDGLQKEFVCRPPAGVLVSAAKQTPSDKQLSLASLVVSHASCESFDIVARAHSANIQYSCATGVDDGSYDDDPLTSVGGTPTTDGVRFPSLWLR